MGRPKKCSVSDGRLERVATHDDWLAAATKRSHAVEDLPETIIEAVRAAKMDKRHIRLNRLMKIGLSRT